MIEYLIRPTEAEWFDFPKGSKPYCPVRTPFKEVSGWGDARIEVDGCPVSFSYEDPGVQVVFEGEIAAERAALIVEEIKQSIEAVSGQSARIVPL
jgi:hypothetical protein